MDLWEPPDNYEALCEISNSGGIMPWLPLRYCYNQDSKRYAIPKPLQKTTITKLKKQSKKAKTKQQDNGKKKTRQRVIKLPPVKEIRELIQPDIRIAFLGAKLTVRKPISKTRQAVTSATQAKIGRDSTGKLHIDK